MAKKSIGFIGLGAMGIHMARNLVKGGLLPIQAGADAMHLALATVDDTDILLTWNCRHLANAQILRRLEREAQHAGRLLPQVCTPLELMGDLPYENEPAA